MNCPNCNGKDTLVYANLLRYEHVYKINKDSTISKNPTKRQISDSQLDYCYCTKCLKVFDATFDNENKIHITEIEQDD